MSLFRVPPALLLALQVPWLEEESGVSLQPWGLQTPGHLLFFFKKPPQ